MPELTRETLEGLTLGFRAARLQFLLDVWRAGDLPSVRIPVSGLERELQHIIDLEYPAGDRAWKSDRKLKV